MEFLVPSAADDGSTNLETAIRRVLRHPFLNEMPRINVFADESGNFDFNRKPGATRYFLITTATMPDCSLGNELLALRRDMAWDDLGLNSDFHATTDEQKVRDRVFALIAKSTVRIDCTILEKPKAAPQTRPTEERFYKTAWYYHMKHIAPKVVHPRDDLFVVGAAIGVKKKRTIVHSAVTDVIRQVSPTVRVRTACWQAASDPCLQVADYCCWAIARKWERGDSRSYDLVRHLVHTEFDLFRTGSTTYY